MVGGSTVFLSHSTTTTKTNIQFTFKNVPSIIFEYVRIIKISKQRYIVNIYLYCIHCVRFNRIVVVVVVFK